MKYTQGRRIIDELKRKPMTYLEMNMLGVSISPQRRVRECLRSDEEVVKGQDKHGRTTWRVRVIK